MREFYGVTKDQEGEAIANQVRWAKAWAKDRKAWERKAKRAAAKLPRSVRDALKGWNP